MELLNQPAWYRDPCTAKLLLRISLGLGFLIHGWMKVSDLAGVQAAFEQMLGFGPLGVIIGFVEVLAGALVLLGLWTRYAALALACVMVGAIVLVKRDAGFLRMELDIAYLAMSLSLAIIGAGRYSLDAKLNKA